MFRSLFPHSKECVDAFAALDSDELMSYKMKFNDDKSLDYRYIGGINRMSQHVFF